MLKSLPAHRLGRFRQCSNASLGALPRLFITGLTRGCASVFPLRTPARLETSMLIHPSLIEKVSLDSREHNADVAADIKRSFAYVGPITVVSHEPAAPEAPVNNEMRLICRMSRPYWTSEGEGDQMWDAMRTWLEAKAYKVASTIANFNKSRNEAGHQTVSYDRVELDMKPYAFGIACAQGDELPDVVAVASRVRELLAQGVLPADMAGIEAPAAVSLAEQVEKARVQAEAAAAAAVAGEGKSAVGEAAGESEMAADKSAGTQADEAAEGEAAQAKAEPADGENGEAQAAPAKAAEAQAAPAESLRLAGDKQSACDDAAEQPAEGAVPAEGGEPAGKDVPAGGEQPADPEAPARLKHASDNLGSLDYTMWDVRLADGTVRTLDSVAGTWA